MYSRQASDLRKVSDLASERPRPSWESSYHPPPARGFHPPPQRSPTIHDPMDPESSDSDVSMGGGEEYRFASPLTAPIPLPPPASKHALESSDAVQARLDELQRVEEHNIKKYELLKAKRSRKDEKILRRREIQDKKWAAIVEARQRRNDRIEARRKREDAAFSQFDHELEEEESNLRRRLKRLKRGLPPDESPIPGGRSISSVSMSPPGPSLSTIPPPPKRHQVGPPGQPDAINPAYSRPSPQPSLATPAKSTLPAPSYSFYRDTHSSYHRPYQPSSAYSTTPSSASPTTTTNGLAHSSQPSADRSQLSHLGRPASPLARPVPSNHIPSNHSPMTPATNPNPPRQASSNYDTRPPPTTSSGFASINAPPASGFATINPRSAATPPTSHVGVSRPLNDTEANKTPSHQANNGVDNNRFQSYTNVPNTASAPSSTSSSKRTPSTTHPYQMSEAFANRHHHCERVDSLNRGVWTSYGIGGTQDNPTGPAVEMYLRCNHDGCSRIDWRTVHGLQCHIVKNHDQPKGTIGSLDKALERYGVPVKEVEDYEREHGRGTAGTMADPKNLKMKLKTKIQDFVRKSTPGSHGIDPQARPAGYRPDPKSTSESPTAPDGIKRSPDAGMTNGVPQKRASEDGSAPQTATASPANTFAAVRSTWMNSSTPSQTLPQAEPEPKRLQGDFGMSDATSNWQSATSQPGRSNGPTQYVPTSTVDVLPPRAESSGTSSVGEAPTPAPTQGVANTTASSVPPATPIPPVQSQPSEAEKVEENQELPAPQIQGNAPTQANDGDVQMTGIQETEAKKEDHDINGQVETEKTAQAEPPAPTAETPEDQSETIVVDADAGKDTAARKQAPQSPAIATKTVPATTPSSARRPTRRSSAARPSVDVEGDASYLKEARAAGNNEAEDKDDKDNKDDKSEKDGARNEPRRSIAGRVLRRGRF